MLIFTKEQLSEVMCKHAEKENGLHDQAENMPPIRINSFPFSDLDSTQSGFLAICE